jgi:hypothetical protein
MAGWHTCGFCCGIAYGAESGLTRVVARTESQRLRARHLPPGRCEADTDTGRQTLASTADVSALVGQENERFFVVQASVPPMLTNPLYKVQSVFCKPCLDANHCPGTTSARGRQESYGGRSWFTTQHHLY